MWVWARVTLLRAVCTLVLVLCLTQASLAQNKPPYNIVDLGAGVTPAGVNNSGQVVAEIQNGVVVITQGSGTINTINIGTLGGTYVFGSSINNQGQVTGFSSPNVVPPVVHSFVYTPGQGMADITPGFSDAEAHGINDSGQVIFLTSGGPFNPAYLYTPGQGIAPLGPFSLGINSEMVIIPRAINNFGAITGDGAICNITPLLCISTHSFLYSPGTGLLDLGSLGTFDVNVGLAISNSGFVTGQDLPPGGAPLQAFLYTPAAGMLGLGTLGGMSYGTGVNSSGNVVGVSSVQGGQNHAFLYTSKTGIVDLNSFLPAGTGWTLSSAVAISDTGFITGNGTLNGAPHGFLLVPGTCGSERDKIIQEYVTFNVVFYPGTTPLSSAPHCNDFTQLAHTANYAFSDLKSRDTINNYSWAIIRSPLVAPAALAPAGFGLDSWVFEAGPPLRPLTSGYRNPFWNFSGNVNGRGRSRHMFGDAADMQNLTGTMKEYWKLHNAAHRARASFIEPPNVDVSKGFLCGLACVHADWRNLPGPFINP
jgi:probable HAF family extracellular repeat protein